MKTYIQPSIILLVLMSAFAALAAPPTLVRVKPENSEEETITIVKGQSITFEAEGNDADGDISGIEWYNNDYLATDSYSSSGNVSMKKKITFSAVGEYNVSCVAFDSNTQYSNGIQWKVKVIEFTRSMYVDCGNGVIGSPRAEDALIKVARDNKITGVHIYGFDAFINKNTHGLWNTFFGKLRSNGIPYISVVIGTNYDQGNEMMAYYDDPEVTHKFDGIVTEIEYWGEENRANKFKEYYEIITFLSRNSIARDKGFKVESYIHGILDQEEANKICDKVDRILLTYYHRGPIASSDVYGADWRRQRVQLLCNAPNARNLSIRALFEKGEEFMGKYTLEQCDASFFEGFDTDNTLVNKYKPTMEGSAYFTYTSVSNEALIAPRLDGFAPGSNGDTLHIRKTDSLEFTISGNDCNENLKGVDWYKGSVREYTDTWEPVFNKTTRYMFKFNEAGTFEISAKLFDATELYLADVHIPKRIVQVIDPSENIARNKKVWQSTTAYGGLAEKAIDGNIASTWAEESVTHTSEEDKKTQAWWTIDLSENRKVIFVKIYNRTDICCMDRLFNFYVFASKDAFTGNTVEAAKNQAKVINRYFLKGAGKGFNINLNAEVRYIRIQLNMPGIPLNLAEVEVYAKELNTPPTPTPPSTPTTGFYSPGQNGNNVKKEQPMLYPNPASDKIMLTMPEAVKFKIVKVGSRMNVPYTREKETITFDIRQLSPGIYLVLAIEKNNRTAKALRFIKQ